MKGPALRALLQDSLLTLEACRDELRDLDAAIGDGDLGITVSEGSRAVRLGLAELGEDASFATVLRTAARRFASANPSTMAALVGAGLAAAARAVGDDADADRGTCIQVLDAVFGSIQQRGGAEVGDKTILDAIAPTLTILRDSTADDHTTLREMIAAAEVAVTDTASLRSQRGRAAWVGDRSIGHADGGATAYLRLLQAIDRALPYVDA